MRTGIYRICDALCHDFALLASSSLPLHLRSLIFGNGISLRRRYLPAPLAKDFSQRGFPVSSAWRKACLGSQRACRFGKRSKTVLLEREDAEREGRRSEKKREHFDGGSSGFSCSRMRTSSFLLWRLRYNARSVFGRKYTMVMGGRKRQAKGARSSFGPEMKRSPLKNHVRVREQQNLFFSFSSSHLFLVLFNFPTARAV